MAIEKNPPPPELGSNWVVAGHLLIERAHADHKTIQDLKRRITGLENYNARLKLENNGVVAQLRKECQAETDKERKKDFSRIQSLEDRLQNDKWNYKDKEKQIENLNSTIDRLNAEITTLETKLQQALDQVQNSLQKIKTRSDERVQCEEQIQMMKKEGERIQQETKATEARINDEWMNTLMTEGEGFGANRKVIQLVEENVSLKAELKKRDQTVADLTDQINGMILNASEQVQVVKENKLRDTPDAAMKVTNTSNDKGNKRMREAASDSDEPREKNPKLTTQATQDYFNTEVYVYDIVKELFDLKVTIAVSLSKPCRFNMLEKICADCVPAEYGEGYTTIVKTENPLFPDSYEAVNPHQFHGWVNCMQAWGRDVRTCRFFAYIPSTDDSKAKSKAAANQVD